MGGSGLAAVRNIVPIGALPDARTLRRHPTRDIRSSGLAIDKKKRIVESAEEARQAESGPSVLAMLIVSTGLAIVIVMALWFAFFRT